VGKTTVGLLLAVSKRVGGRGLLLTTSVEYSPDLVERIGEWRQGWICETVEAFFAIVAEAERGDFIILDSLATLASDHPNAKQVAPSVRRHYVAEPECPVLVINQERWPASSGGQRWRTGLKGRFSLVKIREQPFLISKLEPAGLYLIWQNGKPELRVLTDEECRLWLPRVMYGGALNAYNS
jgi:hypothetical protein